MQPHGATTGSQLALCGTAMTRTSTGKSQLDCKGAVAVLRGGNRLCKLTWGGGRSGFRPGEGSPLQVWQAGRGLGPLTHIPSPGEPLHHRNFIVQPYMEEGNRLHCC